MNHDELRNSTICVYETGAIASAIAPDGEVLYSEGLPVGRHKGSKFLADLPRGYTLELDGPAGVRVIGSNRVRRLAYGEGSHKSGANPDFVTTSASRHERELQRQMQILTGRSERLERRIAAVDALAEQQKKRLSADAQASVASTAVAEPVPATAEKPAPKNAAAE